jgi:hypothetical protein
MDENQNQMGNEHHENPENGNIPAEAPTTQVSPMPEPQETGKSYGPIVGIIIVVILLILAGFYFWGESLSTNTDLGNPSDTLLINENANMEEDVVEDPVIEEVGTEVGAPLSESDEIEDIEAELDATDLDNLDAELIDIDAELNL